MPRIQRAIGDNLIYHIFNRGNRGQDVFHNANEYNYFLQLMKKANTKYPMNIYAYCLMPNHFHISLMPLLGSNLSKWMQWLMTSYVRAYHKCHKTYGHIWQGRYKSFIIQKERYFLNVIRYIEWNPIKAKLVKTIDEWKWSSYYERYNPIEGNNLLNTDTINLLKEWDGFIRDPLTAVKREEIEYCIRRNKPYGNEEWINDMCKQYRLESTIRCQGRPRKQKSSLSPFFY